ncbi:hypothetical protein AJ78_07509, partial [Emergomyces pasteurianus Ep9510]
MIFPQPGGCRSLVRLASWRPLSSCPLYRQISPPRAAATAVAARHFVGSLKQRVFHSNSHSRSLSAPRPTKRRPLSYTHDRRGGITTNTLPPIRPSTPYPLLRQSPPHLLVFMTAPQARSHSGHGHSHGHGHHHHHHDNVYLTSKNKNDPGVRITRIGLLSNLAMAIGKGFGGYIFNSSALIADAYHAATDLVSDFMTLATVSLSLKPPTAKFPLGYGKVESLGALGVSSLLLCGGLLMGLNAAEVLLTQFFPTIAEWFEHHGLLGHGHSHGHSHSHEVLGPNINAAWLAAGSILVKESLYHA